jgi:GNAT superfamily N-acetyltransferase
MPDRATFEAAVFRNWAERFGCSAEELHTVGTEVLPEEQFAGSNVIHIWTIGQRAFARHDPALTHLVDTARTRASGPVALTVAHLIPVLDTYRVKKIEDSVLTYLYPPDLQPTPPPNSFDLRSLTLDDADALATMQQACHPDEVDEGEVSVEDEIGFGLFLDTTLATVATGFRLTGFMDIGVLTHPNFRRRGLGKAAVTALCRWCIDHDTIAQYRCRVDNTGSRNIAARLGFNLIFPQQSIYLSL